MMCVCTVLWWEHGVVVLHYVGLCVHCRKYAVQALHHASSSDMACCVSQWHLVVWCGMGSIVLAHCHPYEAPVGCRVVACHAEWLHTAYVLHRRTSSKQACCILLLCRMAQAADAAQTNSETSASARRIMSKMLHSTGRRCSTDQQ